MESHLGNCFKCPEEFSLFIDDEEFCLWTSLSGGLVKEPCLPRVFVEFSLLSDFDVSCLLRLFDELSLGRCLVARFC